EEMLKVMKFSLLIFMVLSMNLIGQYSKIVDKTNYHFWLHLPNDTVLAKGAPVLIFLHGKSLAGKNLNLVRKYGVLDAIDKGMQIDAIVVAPQIPRRSSWNPHKVYNILRYVIDNYNVDTTRIYVAGMSMGGSGTYTFATAYPEVVAAAISMCGRINQSDPCILAELNLWIHHGKRDRDVPISESYKAVKMIQKCNPDANLKFTVHPKYGHSEIARVFHQKEIYEWLFSFRKGSSTQETETIETSQ
ncbi:MAG TPA: alpha/beta hydrolase-fold protein, partial [Ignavibacteriaceae bacterium]|nr:alpha/beta hydrolase-fold protein [Ignavibacteriaceae bacterium]